ncbi:MerR family transcriptional regulator [Gordonia sp. ABSL1-1]|uniref:MerR family transcriptional regulator n=1 Tax=Gordonia sp. ABSL1-1 TaxID=3053923 RepID=UPI002572BEAA|nr:MerR family transcriptional regulator [Gordonia sp. ABSL1-1]MDL9938239.1 MerR family transcriptional regulator [Gordonia sp. ABSL1-1]
MLIGEVSQRSGVSTRMLRHYDSLGLVTPSGRTSGGYRRYSADDIERLFHVECLRSLGMSLEDVARALGDRHFVPADAVTEAIARTREAIAAQTELLGRLERIRDAAPTDWSAVLRIIALWRAMSSPRGDERLRAALTDGERTLSPTALAQALLTEPEPNVASTLQWALARNPDDPTSALDALGAGLDDPVGDTRLRAVTAIAALPATPTADGYLAMALDDPEVAVRARAAIALGGRGVTSAIPALIELIVVGRADVEAAEVLGALAATPDPALATQIVTALSDRLAAESAEPAVRSRITQALAEIPDAAAHDLLRALATDADPTVAGTAAAILNSPPPSNGTGRCR